VNLALPSIRRDLGSSLSDLQWVIDAYTLVLASLLMLGGSTGDRVGRRRTFQAGLTLFGLGSLLCSLAPSTGWLIAFRAVQAIEGPVRGWGSPVIVGSFLAAAAALAGLLRVESRRAEPLLDPRFFTSIPFSADFAAAARPAWVVVIGCGLVVVALGVVGTTERARATARRTAERFAVPAPAVAPSTAG